MRRIVLSLGVIFGLFGVGFSGAVEYEGAGLRDPFSNLKPDGAPAPAKGAEDLAAQEVLATFTFQGLVLGGKEPVAIVNDKVVKVGTKLNVGEVASITKDGVLVRYGQKEYLLKQKLGDKQR